MSRLCTVPANTASIRISGYALTDGTAFSGQVAVSNIRVDLAGTTDLLVDGAVTEPKVGAGAVTEAKIGTGAVTAEKIAAAAIDITKCASTIRPPEIFDVLPAAGHQGRLVFLTSDNKLYRDTGSAWTVEVPTTDLSGTIAGAQIANGSIDITKCASSIRPPEIFDVLPAPGNKGRIVFLTSDNKLYRDTGTGWTVEVSTVDLVGTITSDQISDGAVTQAKLADLAVTLEKLAAGSVDITKCASTISPPEIFPALPEPGNPGRMVLLTTDFKLYRDTGTEWTTKVATADLIGTISGEQIADAAIDAAKLKDDVIEGRHIKDGVITNAKIAPGTITSAEIQAGSIREAAMNWATHLIF